jgi:hypothetical protein
MNYRMCGGAQHGGRKILVERPGFYSTSRNNSILNLLFFAGGNGFFTLDFSDFFIMLFHS